MLWRKVNLILKLYYTPISLNSRRVWVALLEKEIAFEPLALNLDGDQFKPDFLPINLFHRIPVLVEENLTLVESLAILDYIDAKYRTPALLPREAKALGILRMVEMVTLNELLPTIVAENATLSSVKSGGDCLSWENPDFVNSVF